MSLFKNMNVQLVGGVISAVIVIGGVIYAKISRKSARGSIPSEMKAARLVKFVEEKTGITNKNIELATIPTPVPKAGEVLVKMEASPINPSDLSSLQGTYNSAQKDALPCSIGFEGAGTVVQSGGGVMGYLALGKRCAVVTKGGGCMWAEYAIVPALQAVPLPSDVSFEEGCSVFVNPLTVAAFVEIAQKKGHKAILHTAAASALGKMLVRYGQRNGIEIINVVRRPEQKAVLEKIGARHVIVSSDEKWQTQLEAECKALNCRIAFDAVAGDLTGQILKCMPNKSTIHVYGGLSMQPTGQVRPTDLIFAEKTVSGFWLTPFLRSRNPLAIKALINKVVARLKDDFKTDFVGRYNLKQVAEACSSYVKNMTDGKVLIKCSEF